MIGHEIEVETGNYIDNLCQVGEIEINKDNNSKPDITVAKVKKKKCRRYTNNSSTIDMNRYAENAMEYELKRMYNM